MKARHSPQASHRIRPFTMHSEATLTELIGLLYEAVGEPALWTRFLESFGRTLQTPWCVFHVHDLARRQCDVAAAIGFDPEFVRSYEAHFVSTNVFFIHGKHQLVAGNVCDETALCPDDVLFRSEFYNDWLAPQGMLRGINATILNNASHVSLLGAIRPRGVDGPDQHDRALVHALMPHLRRAVQLHDKVSELTALEHAATGALDRWSLGVIILKRQGGVLLMNRAAEALTKIGDGLRYLEGRLAASTSDETVRLRRLVQGALATQASTTSLPGGTMNVSRPSGARPLHILVAPMPEQRALPSPRSAGCVVFVSDPDLGPAPDAELLRHLYGLTSAESQVAVRLIRGLDVRTIAGEMRVTLNTTRTHVKRVLRKTNTNRQAELTALLLSGPLSARLP
jgi:DNA-binding CsgD family transcriptional regulator